MKGYKIPIIIGIIYMAALFSLSLIRTISLITLIFIIFQFLFHGAFVLIGDRADSLHRKFTESNLAIISTLILYIVSTGFYFLSIKPII